MDYEGSWAVRYKDGVVLSQWEGDKETPLRTIDWPNVEKVIFESQWETRELDVAYDPQYFVPHLRTRTMMVQGYGQMRIFMIVMSLKDQEVTDESVKYVFYWTPVGIVHECHLFNCPQISQWATRFTSGTIEGLPEKHDIAEVVTDAHLV